jgi:uncharacterized protein
LSSRFPTFEPVNAPALSRVDAAERFLHSLGFKQVRVRNHSISSTAGGATEMLLARIEVEQSEMDRFSSDLTLFDRINTSLQELGYAFVTLDLAGYQQGSTNITSLKSPSAKDKGG